MFRRLAALLLASLVFAPAPAQAAGVGFSLPKFRSLSLTDPAGASNSFGGSVQVIGTNFSIGAVALTTGLDYAYTRDFGAGSNYSFFDLDLGLGLPIAVTQAFYVHPAVDGHLFMWVASPQGLRAPSFGVAPRLTAGYRPQNNIAVELSLSHAFLLGTSSARGATQGTMTMLELGGTYNF